MAFVLTVSLISSRVIDGISSNFANTFLSSRQILIIGPMLLELFPFVILNNAMAFVYAYFSLTFYVLIGVFYC